MKMTIEEALKQLEPHIIAKAKTYHIKGMEWKDVAQELRIQIWLSYYTYNPKKASLRTWATRILQNRLSNLAKEKKDLSVEAESLDELLEHKEM